VSGEPCICPLCGKPATRHTFAMLSAVACECVDRLGYTMVGVRGLDGQEFTAPLVLEHPILQGKVKLP
jgi:hypothetical protein